MSAALALLSLLAAADAAPAPARFVVVVGENGGGDTAPSENTRRALSFADDDAARLFTQLLPGARRAALLTTFDSESARVFAGLTDVARAPTKAELARVLGEMAWQIREAQGRGERTELLFAFAGHGDVTDDGTGFLVFADGPFTRDDLATQVIDASPADVNHIVLDACASYFMVPRGGAAAGNQSGSVKLSPALLDVLRPNKAQSAAARAKTGLLVSTSDASLVHESSELQGGVFSYLVRSALAGAADQNGDGRIEYGETAAFIAAAGARIDDPRARLQVHASPPAQRPHAPLQDLQTAGATHFLAVENDGPARVRVLDSHGVPYAEVHVDQRDRERGKPMLLALTGNPYYVVQVEEREAVLVPRKAGATALSSLSFQNAPRPRGDGPFARLFEAPTSAAFVQGFLAQGRLPEPLDGPPFVVDYAEGGAPPFTVPLRPISLSVAGVGAALAVGAAVAVGFNLATYSTLENNFQQTGLIDPQLAVEVEAWRTGATLLTLGAVTTGAAAGALWLWSMSVDDGEVALP